MFSPLSLPKTGIVPIICPFFRHREIFLSSPALATTKSLGKKKCIPVQLERDRQTDKDEECQTFQLLCIRRKSE